MKLNTYLSALLVVLLATIGLYCTGPTASAADGEADVSVSLAELRLYREPGPADPDRVVAGTQAATDVQVTNHDTDVTATGVKVTLPDPGFLTYFPTSGGRVECEIIERSAQCEVGELAPGETITFYVLAYIARGTFGAQTHTAEVTSSTVDPDPANNQAKATHDFFEESDLRVAMVVNGGSAGPIGPDGLIVVQTSMIDGGGAISYNNELKLTVGEGLTAVHWEQWCGWTYSERSITCNSGAAHGLPVSMLVLLRAEPGHTGPFTLRASVTGGQHDPNHDNDVIEYTVPPASKPLADVTLTNTPNVSQARPGQLVTWTTTVTNAGPATAEGLELTDAYPEATLVSAPEECTEQEGQHVVCTLATLPVGQSWTMEFVIKVPSGTRSTYLLNYAGLLVETTDPDGQWSSAISEVTVVKGKPDTRPTQPPK